MMNFLFWDSLSALWLGLIPALVVVTIAVVGIGDGAVDGVVRGIIVLLERVGQKRILVWVFPHAETSNGNPIQGIHVFIGRRSVLGLLGGIGRWHWNCRARAGENSSTH